MSVCLSVCLSLAVEVDVAAVDCTTLKVSYTVNPLPSGVNNQVSLQSFVVTYQPILGGSTGTRTVPLNGNSTEGVLCISGLTANTGYRVTYNAEVMSTITLPSDIPNPVEISTTRECDQAGECSECSCISCAVLCVCVCGCVIHFVIIHV